MRVLPVNEGVGSRSPGTRNFAQKIQLKEEFMKTILRIALVGLSLVTSGVTPVLADGPVPPCPTYPHCVNVR